MVADGTPAGPVAREARALDLEQTEAAVRELLRSYRLALQYASDLPLVGRSAIAGRRRGRWGSRFLARVYAETHVRRQLGAIGTCLQLELVGAAEPGEAERIAALQRSLEGAAEPLFRWRRLVALLTRLPPIAAALPILAAAAARPFAEDVSTDQVLKTLLWLGLLALVLWILVVWPSIRLGFRVKRAIFAGGADLRNPWLNVPGIDRWEGFRGRRFYDDAEAATVQPFPDVNVYAAENDVFRALARRKPAEVPVDLFFALTPYLWYTASAFFFYALGRELLRGASLSGGDWIGLTSLSLIAVSGVIQIPRQGVRNSGLRPH